MSKSYKDGLASVCAIIEGSDIRYPVRVQGIGATATILLPWNMLGKSGEGSWTVTLKESPGTGPTIRCDKCGK